MGEICTDDAVLEGLIKSILRILITEYETTGAGADPEPFFQMHADLFDTPKKKREPKFKRKRILILTDVPMKKADLATAIAQMKENNPRHNLALELNQVDIKQGKTIEKIQPANLQGNGDYADIIAFVTSTKDGNENFHQLLATMKATPSLYPNLLQRFGQKPTEKNLTASLQKTLWFAHKTNDTNQASTWRKYAFYDHLAGLVKKQVFGANRQGELITVVQKYGVDFFGAAEESMSVPTRILVLGAPAAPVADLKRIIVKMGLDPQIFDFNSEYEDSSFSFETLKNSKKYSEVLVGPKPHSSKGKGDYSSGLTNMEQNPETYPHTVRIIASNHLKITQDSFRQALKKTNLYKQMHHRG